MMRKLFSWALGLLLVGTAAAVGQVKPDSPFPDLPGHRTLVCDLHTHTVFSDGQVWPTVRVEEASREGLDVLAITDHIEHKPHRQDVSTDINRPHALAEPLARQRNVVLIRGAEITRATPPGHFNAIFLDDANALDIPDFYEVFAEAARQKAFIFWNHPGWQGAEKGRWGQEQTRLLELGQLHGIEICNGDHYYVDAHREAIDRNLVFIGNSDIHPPASDAPRTPEKHRTTTLVFAREKSAEAVREALFAGRTVVWQASRLIGREEYLKPLFDACIEIRPVHHRNAESVWVEIHNRSELNIELERTGRGRPAKITLPARKTSLITFSAPAEDHPAPATYRAMNFLVEVDTPLEVQLAIPQAPAQAEPVPAEAAAGA